MNTRIVLKGQSGYWQVANIKYFSLVLKNKHISLQNKIVAGIQKSETAIIARDIMLLRVIQDDIKIVKKGRRIPQPLNLAFIIFSVIGDR